MIAVSLVCSLSVEFTELPRTVLAGSMCIENSREFTFNFDEHARTKHK